MSKQELKKHVAAVHIRNRLSLLERKVANILLLNAYEDLLTQEAHTIKVSRLAAIVGFDSKNMEVLKAALRKLAETAIEWNLLDEDGNQAWEISTMLMQARIRGGDCQYLYSPLLREKLYNPEGYARINLAVQRKFTSGYALALYENSVRYRLVGSTGWWRIGVFRDLMGIEEGEYENFKDLNKRVIKPAIAQINDSADIVLAVEFKREQRRVAQLRFMVQDNPRSYPIGSVKEQILKEIQATAAQPAAPDITVSAPPTAAGEAREEVRQRLHSFGVSEPGVAAVVNAYAEDYIRENLAVVERDYLAGKVDHLPGYTVAALKHDYRPRATPFEAAQTSQRQAAQTRREQRAQAQAQLQRLQSDWDRRRLQAALDGLTAAEREALESRFRDTYTGNPIYQRWGKDGLTHPVMQSLFRAFASQELLTEASEADLAVLAAGAGCDLQALRAAAAAG